MKKKVYLWLLAMCVTAGTATPVYAEEPVAVQSTVGENTGNVEESQEQEKAPENNGENSGEENSGEVKAPENSGANSGGEKEPENGGVNSGEGKDTENGGENADEEEKSGEVAEVPEDELDLQELGEENQIAAFSESQPVTTFDELKAALEDKNRSEIQISQPIELKEPIKVTRTVTISGVGEGKLIRGAARIDLIQVKAWGKLTLKNIVLDGKKGAYDTTSSLIIVAEGGSLTLESGAILQNNKESAIQVSNGSLFMEGGTIQDNVSDDGGGIYLGPNATFKMHGGIIQGNTGGSGGGIYAKCQVIMTGGTIQNNTATHGGGVILDGNGASLVMSGNSEIIGNQARQKTSGSWGDGGGIYLSNSTTLTLNGGTIGNNTADRCGGGVESHGNVTVNGGKITNNTGGAGGGIYNEIDTVTMTGGEISGNTSTGGCGGGIANIGTLVMSGGSITGNTAAREGGGVYQYKTFQVSGTVQITGNKENGKISNVYLASDKYVTIESSGLNSDSKIGVNINAKKDLNITQAINDKDYSAYFTSDDFNYKVVDVESDGKHQVSLKKTGSGSGNTGGSESGGSTGGNTGGSESGGTTGGNNSGTTGGNTGNTSGSTTGTSTGTSGGSSTSTATSTPAPTPKETTITVPLQADAQKSTLETGNLPTNLQQRVLNQKISHTVLSSAETGVKVGLDIEAVRAISGQAQGDASVVVQKLDNTTLKGNAAAVIGTRPVVTVQVQDAAGKAITDLGAGSVLVEIPYVLQNGENPGNICAVSTDAEGNVQWILNSVYDSEKQVLRFRTLQGADYGVASIPVGIYQDTIGTDKQADIAFAVSRGLLTGDAKGQAFNPEKAVTMEEFANALDRMTGKEVSNVVLGSFAPDQSITREEMAVLLVKYADTLGIVLPKVETATAFADQNQISAQAVADIRKLQQAGVLEGKTLQTFAPRENLTRADLCTTLRLFLEMMVRGTCRP